MKSVNSSKQKNMYSLTVHMDSDRIYSNIAT